MRRIVLLAFAGPCQKPVSTRLERVLLLDNGKLYPVIECDGIDPFLMFLACFRVL